MGKRVRKARRKKFLDQHFLFVEFLLIIIVLIFSLDGIFLYYQCQHLKKENFTFRKEYHTFSNLYLNKKAESNNLNKKIKSYQDIDRSIQTIQKKYFSRIKQLEDDILAHKSDKKIAYLTFDDGPYYNTHKVLDILDQYHVKATFFTISMNGEYCFDNKSENCFALYPEYVKRGHTIANHTYTHAIRGGLYRSADSFMDAVIRQEEHIKTQTGGYVTNIVRFPGGSAQAKDLKDPIIERLRERGYGWVDWTAQDGDGKGIASWEDGWNTFTSSINDPIEVILFHDYNRITTEILPSAITYLEENGYQIYPLFYESNMIQK